jgi:hypothetical protein
MDKICMRIKLVKRSEQYIHYYSEHLSAGMDLITNRVSHSRKNFIT